MKRVRVLQIPKLGVLAEDCEDAVATRPDTGRYAVADGAGATSWAREWAQILVELAVEADQRCTFEADSVLREARTRWSALVPWNSLDNWARRKAERGAAATLALVTLCEGTDQPATDDHAARHWHLATRGDACVFVVRRGELEVATPASADDMFGTTAALISCDSEPPPLCVATGDLLPGDLFVLTTDAIGQQIHRFASVGQMDWAWISWLAVADEHHARDSFAAWIRSQREIPNTDWQMHNDDVTILVLDTSPLPEGPVWHPAGDVLVPPSGRGLPPYQADESVPVKVEEPSRLPAAPEASATQTTESDSTVAGSRSTEPPDAATDGNGTVPATEHVAPTLMGRLAAMRAAVTRLIRRRPR